MCVCVSAFAHAPVCPPRRAGWRVGLEGVSVGCRAGKRLQSKAHPGAPGVWVTPAVKRGDIHAHCSSASVVGVPDAGITVFLV